MAPPRKKKVALEQPLADEDPHEETAIKTEPATAVESGVASEEQQPGVGKRRRRNASASVAEPRLVTRKRVEALKRAKTEDPPAASEPVPPPPARKRGRPPKIRVPPVESISAIALPPAQTCVSQPPSNSLTLAHPRKRGRSKKAVAAASIGAAESSNQIQPPVTLNQAEEVGEIVIPPEATRGRKPKPQPTKPVSDIPPAASSAQTAQVKTEEVEAQQPSTQLVALAPPPPPLTAKPADNTAEPAPSRVGPPEQPSEVLALALVTPRPSVASNDALCMRMPRRRKRLTDSVRDTAPPIPAAGAPDGRGKRAAHRPAMRAIKAEVKRRAYVRKSKPQPAASAASGAEPKVPLRGSISAAPASRPLALMDDLSSVKKIPKRQRKSMFNSQPPADVLLPQGTPPQPRTRRTCPRVPDAYENALLPFGDLNSQPGSFEGFDEIGGILKTEGRMITDARSSDESLMPLALEDLVRPAPASVVEAVTLVPDAVVPEEMGIEAAAAAAIVANPAEPTAVEASQTPKEMSARIMLQESPLKIKVPKAHLKRLQPLSDIVIEMGALLGRLRLELQSLEEAIQSGEQSGASAMNTQVHDLTPVFWMPVTCTQRQYIWSDIASTRYETLELPAVSTDLLGSELLSRTSCSALF